LRALRAACRKFLEKLGADGPNTILYADQPGHYQSWTFFSAMGELRGIFGVQLAKIAAHFKLDIEDGLASILPADADADTGDDDRLFRRIGVYGGDNVIDRHGNQFT
jgi:hypothetical protein